MAPWQLDSRGGRRIADGGNESCLGRACWLLLRRARRNDADAPAERLMYASPSVRSSDIWPVICCLDARQRLPSAHPTAPTRRRWCRLLYGSVNRFHCPVPRTPGLKFTPDRANWSTLTAEMEIGFTPASLEMPSQLNNELNENFPARPLQEGTSPWHAAIVPRPADRDATRFFKSIKIRGRILSPANTVWYAFGRICLRVCL